MVYLQETETNCKKPIKWKICIVHSDHYKIISIVITIFFLQSIFDNSPITLATDLLIFYSETTLSLFYHQTKYC